jgi:hypothetical protein
LKEGAHGCLHGIILEEGSTSRHSRVHLPGRSVSSCFLSRAKACQHPLKPTLCVAWLLRTCTAAAMPLSVSGYLARMMTRIGQELAFIRGSSLYPCITAAVKDRWVRKGTRIFCQGATLCRQGTNRRDVWSLANAYFVHACTNAHPVYTARLPFICLPCGP